MDISQFIWRLSPEGYSITTWVETIPVTINAIKRLEPFTPGVIRYGDYPTTFLDNKAEFSLSINSNKIKIWDSLTTLFDSLPEELDKYFQKSLSDQITGMFYKMGIKVHSHNYYPNEDEDDSQ